ncbi:hypothetical protein JHK86_004441 [Glycine max]|nr:hypothetical protein JHK86_004441 [Glycine max]
MLRLYPPESTISKPNRDAVEEVPREAIAATPNRSRSRNLALKRRSIRRMCQRTPPIPSPPPSKPTRMALIPTHQPKPNNTISKLNQINIKMEANIFKSKLKECNFWIGWEGKRKSDFQILGEGEGEGEGEGTPFLQPLSRCSFFCRLNSKTFRCEFKCFVNTNVGLAACWYSDTSLPDLNMGFVRKAKILEIYNPQISSLNLRKQ